MIERKYDSIYTLVCGKPLLCDNVLITSDYSQVSWFTSLLARTGNASCNIANVKQSPKVIKRRLYIYMEHDFQAPNSWDQRATLITPIFTFQDVNRLFADFLPLILAC